MFFKMVDPGQLADPGEQLKRVLAFKRRVEADRTHLFKPFKDAAEFDDLLERQLAAWKREHVPATGDSSAQESVSIMSDTAGAGAPPSTPGPAEPGFDYWIGEASRQMGSEPPDYPGALFCGSKALSMSVSPRDSARAQAVIAEANFFLGNFEQAIFFFSAIAERTDLGSGAEARARVATALLNKGIALGRFGRSEQEITVYDEVVARFGTAAELPLDLPRFDGHSEKRESTRA
ncbi:MAG: hypothetical protein IVW54_21890, partial [Candidatus Binataceae bacterium]|nr:hypothetical protein [Candidatus Binataceae bacterium]